MKIRTSSNAAGFTLIELLVVIIVALLLMFIATMMFNAMFRGQEVRSAAKVVEQAISDARELAAMKRRKYFVAFRNDTSLKRGIVEVWLDDDRDNDFDNSKDVMIKQSRVMLPRWCYFADDPSKMYPDWLAVSPTSYIKFSAGYPGESRTDFDQNFAGSSPSLMGDIVIVVENKPHNMCLDIDKVAGKVRRQEYLHIPN